MNSFLDAIRSQQAITANYMLLILVGAVVAIVLYRAIPRRHRWRARLAGVTAFVVLFAGAARQDLKYLPAMVVAGAVVVMWINHFRRAGIRLPHWLIITLPALIVRLPGMFEPLWYDETFTAALARLPFDRMTIVNLYDVHPPLWYLIEWINVRIFGSSEFALRLPALAFGILSCVLLYNLARRFVRPRAALGAGMIMALLPAQIYYSHEARGYSLLVCVVLYLITAALDRRSRDFVLLSYVVPAVHSLGLIYVGLIGVWALLSGRLKWQTVMLGAGASLPGVALALIQARDVADGFWLQNFLSPAALLEPLYRMTLYYTQEPYILLGLAVVVGVTALSLYSNRRRWRRADHALLLVMLFGVPGMLGFISFAWRNVYLDRAMLPAFSMLPILWAMLFNRTNKGERNAARWILLPMIAAVAVMPKTIREGGTTLAAACRGTDMAFTTSISMAFVTNYYVAQPIVWTHAGDTNQSLPPEAIAALGWQRADFEDLPGGSVCAIDGQTVLSRQDERDYMAAIRAQADHVVTVDVYEAGFVKAYIYEGSS
ncbi:MAG: glycosyltransferase family 39 protein [Anaerolineae bacterium]|nr:glycosyltransferase family 39 protein [Anaerolineae bacterium]